MTSFQGYAQSSSVESNTIKVHDPAKKILEEKRKKSEQMRRQGVAETNTRNQYLAGLKEAFIKEDAVRSSNEVLRKGFSGDWQKAFSKQWETRIANAEAKATAARNEKSTLEQVAHLLPKAMAVNKQIDDKRRKDGMALGNALSSKFGIDIENLDAIQNVKGNLRDLYAADSGVIAELREKGASFEEIQQIRRLSGYRRLGVQEAQLTRAGLAITNTYDSKNSKPYKLGGGLGEHTLASAMKSGNKNLLPAVDLAIRQEILAPFEGFDQDLVKLHLTPALNRQSARMLAYTSENSMKRAIADQEEEDKTLLETQINIDGPQAFIDAIHIGAGPNNEYMSHSVEQNGNYVAALIEEGRLGDDFIESLKEHKVLPNGEKVEIAYGERWGKWIDKFEASSAKAKKNEKDKINANLALEEAKFKLQANQAEDKIIAEYENLTEGDFVEMYKMATEFNPKNTHLKTTIDKYLGMKRGSVNDELGEPFLFRLENNNMLTRRDVINQRMSPEKTNEWLKKADKLSPFKPTDEIDKGFKEEAKLAVENILTRYGTKSEKVQSSSMARQHGVIMMRKYYKKAMIATNGDTEASKTQAIAEFNKLLTTDAYKIAERRNVDGRLIQEPHFPFFQVTAKKYAYPFSQYTTEKFRKNPNIFKEELMGPAEDLIEWGYGVEAGTSKGLPTWVYHITSKMGNNPDGGQKISPVLVAYEQLALAVGRKRADELIPADLIQVSLAVEDKIDPSWRSIMCLGPNEAQCGLYWSKQTKSNTIKPKNITTNHNIFKSKSEFRGGEDGKTGLSDNALFFTERRY